jgi:1-acyl-sn-glycerol-3-phosphate acyltransferase
MNRHAESGRSEGLDARSWERLVGACCYRLGQLAFLFGLFPVRVRGGRLPAGPVVVVANHACFADGAFLTRISWRRIHFVATAEAFRRRRLVGHVLRGAGVVPVRRYRHDLHLHRTVRRLLAAGRVVGLSVEGEASPWGDYRGALPVLAALVARLGVPVVPVGISGSYDAGPCWADTLRRRPVTLRVGEPIAFDGRDPKEAIDAAVVALLDAPDQPVHLEGLPRDRLYRVLWACPRCAAEGAWHAAELACGARFAPTPDGLLRDELGRTDTLASLGRALTAGPVFGGESVCPARGLRERSPFGQIEPLEPMGDGILRVSPSALAFRGLTIPMSRILSVSTEEAELLQVATGDQMWQFRPEGVSVFRLRRIVGALAGAARRPRRPADPARLGGPDHRGRPDGALC